MQRHHIVQNEDINLLSKEWHKEKHIPDKCAPHREELIAMLSEFLLIWGGHLECINKAQNRKKELQDHT